MWKELVRRSGLVVFLRCFELHKSHVCTTVAAVAQAFFHVNLTCLPGTFLTMPHPVTAGLTDPRQSQPLALALLYRCATST